MTREEAWRKAKGYLYDVLTGNEADEIIKALEQDEDCVSRKALPPITPQQEYGYIAKAFQFGLAFGFAKKYDEMDEVMKEVKKAATPKPKIGHWMQKYGEDGCGELYSTWVCSECGRDVGFNLANIEDVLSDYPYCHCGAKMEVEE